MQAEKYDAEIFASARLGDANALNELLTKTQPDIRRYAKRSCASSDIDDAVQETLWILSRRIGAVKVLTSLPAWLFTIVRRECARVAQRTKSESFIRQAEDISDWENDEQLAHQSQFELSCDLTTAIQSLPEHYRHVVLLRDMKGMSIEEIANQLGRSRESIKGQLYRTRLLIREYLLN
ncbi:sigma-70 family RNA polymerase sigma factor [Vibrio pectenicida]|uniref:Sigma-70 family RNA polymerase sigma factor n=2 Tax=Vibrio pectenicida TaxID=62763 RepID=A0A427U1R8_9VIBR|nr:sigma-70 family RNA polymerase sigma factor [Vibrio pectenicida]